MGYIFVSIEGQASGGKLKLYTLIHYDSEKGGGGWDSFPVFWVDTSKHGKEIPSAVHIMTGEILKLLREKIIMYMSNLG